MPSSVKAAWKRSNLADLPTSDPGNGRPWLENNVLHVGESATVIAATPVASPAEGSYGATQSITLTCATSGAAIYYTVDGTTPTISSTLYTSAISISSTTTLKAIAVASGYTNSAVLTAVYTIAGFPSLGTWQFQLLAVNSKVSGGAAATTLGDRIAQVNDLAGSNHATQSTSNIRPVYVPTCGLTGKPAIRLAHGSIVSNTGGLVAPSVSVNSRNFSFYAIMRPHGTGTDSYGLFSFGSSSALSSPMIDFTSNAARTYTPVNSTTDVSLYGNPMVITIVGTASGVNVYRNTAKTTLAAFDAATVTGGSLFYRGDGYPFAQADIYRCGLIDSQLSDGDVASLVAYAQAEYGVASSFANAFVMQGDSLTQGELDSPPTGQSIPLLIADQLGPSWKTANAGVSGITVSTMTSRAPWAVDRIISGVSGTKIAVLFGGTNDLFLDTASAATTYSRIQAWCAARQTAGFTNIKVCTILKRDFASDPGDLSTRLAATNVLIRAGEGVDFDKCIDLNAMTEFSSTLNTTYYTSDRLHITQAARQLIANTIYATI